MKILVTGGAGFIGSNIVDTLIEKEYSVIVLDNLSSGRKENVNKKAKFYKADICDQKKVINIFKQEKPQAVIHHAAQIDVRKSITDPIFDVNVNILGSINILSACVQTKAKKIIFASSGGTIYGECKSVAPKENSMPSPLSPYGIAKNSVENYIKFYSQIYGLEYTILRYGNVFGPRQDPHGEAGVVAIFAQRMLKNKEIIVFGDGKQIRDYVFVSDAVDANIRSLANGKNEIINIGTAKPTSVNKLVDLMSKVNGYKKKAIRRPKRDGELFKSFLNINKAKKILGWTPKISLDKGIKITMDYFKEALNK
ncbi:MAG: NAD-dependent epimerase/dehydratase family protein [Endomicrobium sp.]|jgi:UDP-glucose 4-epimerase|nr:NAD-dependent epimerase/dehydratase family protein [Endomicrobium sp.]